ncbi:MAG: endolytic transglycosylase MltG [Desulfobacteraceae bacterium]|nr:endolytic transglycosylase MltG [Desulfobacteraceae bacterium]MBC2754200.1 endolytic transglycosylase MltG [Desulfobacteraceae bacterium]
MKKRHIVFLIAGLIIIGLPAYFCADIYFYANTPADVPDPQKVIITISPGQSFNKIVDHLYQKNIITFPSKFKLIARLKKSDRKIIAGEYELSRAMSPLAILKQLTDGYVRLHRLSIPEGFNISQIAEKVEAAGFCDKQSFISAATDEEQVRKMGISTTTFEGFLFPDTYYFSNDVSPQQIISSMVDRFHEALLPEWKARAQEMGFSVNEIITLASIIEKETGVASERRLISSVFHNRIKQRMRLASDPTVIYGIKNFNGNITKKNLNTYTPYNTYMIAGLPPGPIANPGSESIKAALYPAKTNYLYFVAKRDKTHYFSSTLAEHNRAVRKYQLRRR